jgi:uncharacterized protein YjeT (DUF2065 family)
MDPLRYITLAAVCLIFVEGFVLSLFPEQLREIISQADPKSLQMAGWAETAVAIGLLAALLVR